ncbi:MAG: 3-oxoacyl-[acyl-carrier-protein] reductase [Candidatus Marinimicrobia bacterium]|nr:3-oxoacyl-[acyl-carrier-protein] reductase [Candidatus Neomarinimicrobiota bacterium]MDP6935973.1 3-oxoacyl-[acyl-carrier-protein] reductase [Candidatus Neomarinimicrobiota bacterium]
MQYCDLNSKTAIVTGASRGIGKAIALKLASNGATVVLVSRNEEELNTVKSQIESSNGTAMVIPADVSDSEAFMQLVNSVSESRDSVDILINNAGITRDNLIMRMKDEDWDAVMNVNLKSCYNGIKAVTRPMMKNKGGRIVNISSVIGQIGNAGQGNYAASKAGIIGLTKSMAKELGSRNITVNAVAPGYISTEMTDNLDENVKDKMLASIPLGRLGSGEDVANLVCFLVSENASYITGQTFNVDGGMVMY